MQVTLTPINQQDPPMTFELEDGGSLTLGGIDSGAQLSWDLLEAHSSLSFQRKGSLLILEATNNTILLVNQKPMQNAHQASSGDSLDLGSLQCTLSIQATNNEQEHAHHDDDIFQSIGETSQNGFESSFNAPASISMDTSRWLFKVLTGPNAGAQMSLEEGKVYNVGSDAQSCDIVLTDLSVSKQHLKLCVFASGEMTIQDLKSRNGVLVNGEKIEEKASQSSSAIITAGATTFMVVDRTSEQKTIVTPSLPVKERVVVEKMIEDTAQRAQEAFGDSKAKKKPTNEEQSRQKRRYVVLSVAAAIALIAGLGIYSIFDDKIVINHVQPGQIQEIAAILEEYPYFDYNFNDDTGTLTINGHILTEKDKRQVLSKLSQIKAIQRVDDTNLVVDELVWQQFNMAIEKNFKGISLSASAPGAFVLSGTLSSLAQAENLTRYLRLNFPYNDNLQNRVTVIEQLLASINERLQAIAPGELIAEINQGEVTFVGTVPAARSKDVQAILEQVKTTPGIRNVRNMIIEQANNDEGGMVDLSQNYNVTGFSKASDANSSIMINGRILQRGDQLDGMTIVSIRARTIVLERDGIKYRINYNS